MSSIKTLIQYNFVPKNLFGFKLKNYLDCLTLLIKNVKHKMHGK